MSSEDLISLVEQHLAIWDKGSEVYKDKFEKEKAWLAVARGVHHDWDELSQENQNKKMNGLKKKWRNMKDAMKKFLHTKSGDSAKKKKYVHFDALSFLINAADKRRTSGNYDLDDSSQEEDGDHLSLVHDALSDTQSISTPPSTSQASAGASTVRSSFKKPTRAAKVTPFQESLMNSLEKAAVSLTKSQAPEDPDRLYLLSVLPDYKHLNISQKWEFRQYVADFFRNTYASRSFQATPTPYEQQQYSIHKPQQWGPAQRPRYPVQGTPYSQHPTFSENTIMQPHTSQSPLPPTSTTTFSYSPSTNTFSQSQSPSSDSHSESPSPFGYSDT